MTMRNIQIQLENGLEARPVALLVQEASKYESRIYVQSGDRKVNAKSIMGIFSLDLLKPIRMTVHSDDCQAFLDAVAPFVVQD